MDKDNRLLIGITSISHLAVHAQMMVFPTLMLLFQHEFGLGLDSLGIMATAGAFMFGLGAIPAGFLEKKLGGRVLLLLYQIGSAIGGIILVLAHTPIQMTLGLAMLGLSSSIYHPAGLTILSRRLKNLSKGLAIHGVAGSTGLALGPLLAGITAEYGSWRASYLIWVILQIGLALSTFFLVSRSNRQIETENDISINITDRPSIILYYIMAITLGFSFGGITTFMPAHFGMQTGGIFNLFPETLKAGLFTTLVFTSGIVGQLLGGYFGDKYKRTKLLFWIIFFNIPAIALLGFTAGWFLFFSSIIMGVVHFMNQPISNALLADLTPSTHRGLGYGISFFLSFGIGGLAPAIGGWIANAHSIEMVFPFMAISLIPGVISGWFLIQRKSQMA
ncbi:MAG: MFS transporter [Candidatus Marinimicrobia bacterium]|jgi:MFS family permease|nr:MFS transporter [Candidatus Neomarinimicrobiota bacterium]MBT3502426.1 MFS transporter [Candidatus Neomarinimicrobiota bacterium]MBT3838776.1 MFS transporter [Candidatus Neomarinimicrobiota bacterium]MBT3999650.1 MFS transporter [Candidatus Neomarinimicrobiota bacterium]MBT4578785.1 MFS transporter [Candidatus Neomarinimicrobiota bacterium]